MTQSSYFYCGVAGKILWTSSYCVWQRVGGTTCR